MTIRFLHFGEDRLVRHHVGVHGGSRRHVVAVGYFDDILHDCLLLPAPALNRAGAADVPILPLSASAR